MKKPTVIIFNMTPRSGKDTAANHLFLHFGGDKKVKVQAFADKVLLMTQLIFGVSKDEWHERYEAKAAPHMDYIWMKDVPWHRLVVDGRELSQRKACQYVAETVCKPTFGENVYGWDVAKGLDPDKINIITDGGFDHEIKEILKVTDKVLVIRRDRLGNGWEGDTRSWISENLGHHIEIPGYLAKDVDVATYLAWVRGAVKGWLETH